MAFFIDSSLIIIIVALLFVAAIPVLIAAVVFFAIRQRNKSVSDWRHLSEKLQLAMPNPNQLELVGKVNGCDIKTAVGARRSGDSTELFTYCETKFSSPLRFILRIESPKGIITKLVSGDDGKLGLAAFDDRFSASCYSPDVLRRLLLAPFPSPKTENLLGDLMLAGQSFKIIKISDKGVYVEISGRITDEQRIRDLIMTTTTLANRFREARASFPPEPWERQLSQNWQNYAAQNGLRFDQNAVYGLRKSPRLLDRNCIADRGQRKCVADKAVRLRFPHSLMSGLKIIPETSLQKTLAFLGAQDVKTGNEQFDRMFIVKAKNIAQVKGKLSADFCNAAAVLANGAVDFEINDEEMTITVPTVIGDHAAINGFINQTIHCATLLLN
jgi:hypothetical protein